MAGQRRGGAAIECVACVAPSHLPTRPHTPGRSAVEQATCWDDIHFAACKSPRPPQVACTGSVQRVVDG
jgi:hypothetical protein